MGRAEEEMNRTCSASQWLLMPNLLNTNTKMQFEKIHKYILKYGSNTVWTKSQWMGRAEEEMNKSCSTSQWLLMPKLERWKWMNEWRNRF